MSVTAPPRGAPTAPEPSGRQPDPASDASAGRSMAERVSFLVSALIVAGVLAVVTYLHFTQATTPVDVVVRFELTDARRTEAGYVVPVEVSNAGGETGVDVRVVVALSTADGRETTAEVTVPFLAGHARHRGALVFPDDPAAGTLEVEYVSYLEP